MVSIYRHNHIIVKAFVDIEILYLQQDVGQDPRPLFSESFLNEVNVYIYLYIYSYIFQCLYIFTYKYGNQEGESTALKSWPGLAKDDLDCLPAFYQSKSKVSHRISILLPTISIGEFNYVTVTNLVNLIIPDPEVEELLQQLANIVALPLQVRVLRFGLAVAKAV